MEQIHSTPITRCLLDSVVARQEVVGSRATLISSSDSLIRLHNLDLPLPDLSLLPLPTLEYSSQHDHLNITSSGSSL